MPIIVLERIDKNPVYLKYCQQNRIIGIIGSNNLLMQPFHEGWKREIVLTNTVATTSSDIYYITPCGKTLRSSKDLERYLSANNISQLSLNNFS